MKKIFNKALSHLYKKNKLEFNNLIEHLDDVNFQDKDGRSLLTYAVLENDILATETLIKNGANINLSDNNGWTPLHFSVSEHFIEITKVLLENGAEVNAKDTYGNTIISRGTFTSKGRGEIIKLLLSYGADPEIANDSGVNALSLAKTIGNYDIIQFFNRN